MKYLQLLVLTFILVYTTNLSANVIICNNSAESACLEYVAVSYDRGSSWMDVFKVDVDFSEEKVKFTLLANKKMKKEPLYSLGTFQGMEWEITTESGKIVHNKIEVKNNKIYFNDELNVVLPVKINMVAVKLPDFGGQVIFLNINQKNTYIGSLTPVMRLAAITAGVLKKSPDVRKKKEKVRIYLMPNPIRSSEKLTLKSNVEVEKIEIFDIRGNLILLDDKNWKGEKSVRINRFSQGVYFVRIHFYESDKIVTKKIIVLM